VVATFGASGGFAAGGWSAISGSLAESVVMGAAIGAASSAVQMAIAGGGWDHILRSGLTGAATGAIGAAMAYGLHAAFSALGETPGALGADQMGWHIAHAAAEGAVGGGISEFTGGNFKDGFIGSGVSAFLTPFAGRLGLGQAVTGGIQKVAARTAVAATIGGTASALSGGKFANGAISAGFMHLFNQEALNSIPGVDRRGTFRKVKVNANGEEYYYYVADPKEAVPRSDKMYGLRADKAGVGQDNWGECVSLCKALAGLEAPDRSAKGSWVPGPWVDGTKNTPQEYVDIPVGTAVGIYSNGKSWTNEHSGLFMGYIQSPSDATGNVRYGFDMLQQFPHMASTGAPAYPHIRHQWFNAPTTFSHNGSNFRITYIKPN